MEWMFAPIDATRVHDVGWHLSWHARLMVIAWAFLVPSGVLAARFFKILPKQNWPEVRDSKTWWNIHRGFQYTSTVLMITAVILIYNAPPLNISSGPHSYLGWIVLALVGFQILGGILRGSKGGPTDKSLRGDHFDMSFKRLLFEVVHKLFGYGALVLSVAAILSGMWQANAPVWMWFVLPVWWSVLIVLFMACQRRGMAVDTYQAIWGPDPTFPGNVRKASRTGNRQSRHEAGE